MHMGVKKYQTLSIEKDGMKNRFNLTLPIAIQDKESKLTFIFTLPCGASKGFIKTLQAFIKTFEAAQRSEKIKIQINSYFNTTF